MRARDDRDVGTMPSRRPWPHSYLRNRWASRTTAKCLPIMPGSDFAGAETRCAADAWPWGRDGEGSHRRSRRCGNGGRSKTISRLGLPAVALVLV